MNKLDYISAMLSKVKYKQYEHYVLTRFWHRLNDLTIEINPQQYIATENGYKLVDIYLPQFNIIIEIDEKHHTALENITKDQLREKDIISALDAEIIRIPIYDLKVKQQVSIDDINSRIDSIIEKLNKQKPKIENFKEWGMSQESSINFYIKKGKIELSDRCAFRTIKDALNCFGKQYKGFQQAGVKHSQEEDTVIWFPKLYENQNWCNSINYEENQIIEKAKNIKDRSKHVDKHLADTDIDYRIVFAHSKDIFGKTLYRFKGKFKLNREKSNYETGLIWDKVSDSVATYEPIIKK